MGAVSRILWVALVMGAASATAQQKQMRIQFAEPVQLKAAAGHTEFDAYGRRFSVDLQQNERLLQELPASAREQLGRAQLMRGKLDGVNGSWVRLTRVGPDLEGAIWDGQDLYVVSTLARIAKNLTTPISAAPGQAVVYRLSDTLDSLPEAFCGLDERTDSASSTGVSGLKQYQSLVQQIATATTLAPAEQLNISLIADRAFQQVNGSESAAAMLARLNIVDGIFAEQIGVLLTPTEFRQIPATGSNPFTATEPSQLLNQLAEFRENTPAVRTPGLAHLFTGMDLDGSTIGIAYRDTLCDPRLGVSLSDSELGAFASALVMAHELGHNFGAEHDGAAGGACATTDYGYLMWPQFNGSSVFSTCSRNTIAQSVARARGICVLPAQYADLAVSAPQNLDASANTVFTLPVTVRSIGNATAIGATVKLTLQGPLTFQSAVLPQGACSVAGSEVTCQLGDIAGNSERVVELKLMSSQVSSTNIVVTVGAANDHLLGNSTAQTYLRFTSAVDIKLAMTVSPDSLYANDPIEITLDVSSVRSQTVHGGQLWVSLFDLKFDSATAGAHTCVAVDTYRMRCDLADIPSGTTTRIVMRAHGEHRGDRSVSAQVQVADDGDYSNNNAEKTVRIVSENDFLIRTSADSLSFETGTIQQVVFTLSTIGRNPSIDSELRIWAPWNGRLDSVVTSAGTCTVNTISTFSGCEFGDVNPGAVITVTVRFHTTDNGRSTLLGEATYLMGASTIWINSAATEIYSNLPIDAVASTLSATALEGQPGSAYAGIESVGLQPAQNVVATLEVPAAIRLTGLNVTNANNWTCSVLTPQRARCTGAFAAAGSASILYAFVSDTPGAFTAKLTISANGDGNALNNTSESILTIDPYIDAGVSTTETQMQLVAGQDHTVAYTVTTGTRAVPGVFAIVTGGQTDYVVASVTAAGNACPIDPVSGWGRCDLGNLPANASVPMTVTFRTTADNRQGAVRVYTATSVYDRNPANDGAVIQYTTVAYTDVQLQVLQTSATAVNGAGLAFPRITVSTVGAYYARTAVVEVPLPAFTTLQSVSGSSVFCTGTSVLRCEIFPIPPGESRSIDLVLNTVSTGTFTSNVTLQSGNDSTAGNNAASVALSVTAAPPPPPPSGGAGVGAGGGVKKGGGGRFEWLALGFLVLLGANRARRARLQPRVMSRH